MDNNDILRRIRYTFDFNDKRMMELFAEGGYPATREEISAWLKSEDDLDMRMLRDKGLATFLNGFIIHKRGKREGPQPVPEDRLTNNLVLRKLKIALDLKSDGMLKVFERGGRSISDPELTSFFRKPGHAKYREVNDQYLRGFLNGLKESYRRH